MLRGHEKRPGKTPTRKMTPDGLEEQSSNIGDTSRESFNLRTERSDTALGRGAPRDSPASVHSAIARHKEQARRFSEHAARSQDTHLPDSASGGSPIDAQPIIASENTTELFEGGKPQSTQPQAQEALPDKVNTALERHKHGAADHRRFSHFNTDKPETRYIPDALSVETDTGVKLVFEEPPQNDQSQIQESMPEGQTPARDTPLPHDRPPRSMPERPGRLRHGTSTAVPKNTPRHKPGSTDAAKYISPGGVEAVSDSSPSGGPPQSDASPDTVKVTQPDAVKPDGAVSSQGTPRHKTKPDGRLRLESTDTAASIDDTIPDAAANNEEPTAVTEAGESEKPAITQDSGKNKKTGAGRGGARSHADKPGKLQFSKDEATPAASASTNKPPPGKKLQKTQSKAEQSAVRLDKARKNLPQKRSVKRTMVFDEKRGKPVKKLTFETEVKSQYEHLKGPLLTRPPKAGANAAIVNAHRKLYQVEHENVGTQAAHRGEMLVEGGMRGAYRLHKTAPYRRVEKLERRTAKLNIKASYQQALNDNPKLKSSFLSRMAQKRKIKKDYAKAVREGKKAAQRAKKTGDVIGKVGQAIVRTVARHPVVFGIIGVLFLLVIIISSLFTSCSNMASGVGGVITSTTYLAMDADVDNAELYYTEWETDLQMQIGRAEADYGGYDEYRYSVDNVGHNPYELMAYLTVMYQEFHYADIEAALRSIFAEQYQLAFTPSVETRYTDPTDVNGDGDYGAYDWYVLTVTLTSRSFTDVIAPNLNTEQLQQHSLLMRSKGNRQYAGSPFDFNWLPYVTSYYGYRVHPTTGAKDYHMGIDIGVPTGTDIHAAHGGTVTTGYDAGGYGHYIALTGTDGLVTKYAHLDSVLVSNGQTVAAGDIIAKSGNSGNSTGPHLHFEVIKNGQYLNPIYFSQTNDSGSGPVYGYAGTPMGDGSYTALIAEAELYLGMPYRWGGSSPATSFDCSGYVSWVLTQSGVKNTGRLGAQGLYNICTPVSPAEAMPGDLIFFTGTYSAPLPVTHVGIYVGGGMMIHCGNPIQYTSINTSYWQSHFYAYGRIN